MARFGVLIFAFAFAFALLLSSADGWAYDKNGNFIESSKSCGYYLDAYSRTTLVGRRDFKGPWQAHRVSGWVTGYLTAYNELSNNGKKDILGGMTPNDTMRWIAAWCRDNPSKDTHDAVSALTDKLER